MNFEIWGLTGSLNTEHAHQMAYAEERLWDRINAFDASCNRFRTDSEISRLNAQQGGVVAISETLELALSAALLASEVTGGLCDPTVLPALLALGYDRDYNELVRSNDVHRHPPVLPLGPTAIHLDRERHTVELDPQCQIDLGSSAKALIADLVADDVTPTGGVVVEFGGDVALRGSGPQGPWVVGVGDSLAITGDEPRISLAHGGIATSSITARTWRAGEEVVNHIIDPRTGTYARGVYSTVTITAASCVLANAFATAALLWGEDAGYHIAQAGWSGRLVRHDGTVEYVGGWPHEEENSR
jgi:thiamine biosynthesis lipoprotein